MTHVLAELFVWIVGLCVGSFLNVVVYRLPRGLSVAEPRWSFCPSCGATLGWYDNIPLLSWLVLRARCRACAAPISARYPVVEALTGLALVLVYHLLIVEAAREGLSTPALPLDAPLLLAWIVLVAALIASAAMDVVSYLVDTRVLDFATFAAVILYALWPRPAFFSAAAGSPLAAAALVAAIISGFLLWRWRRSEAATADEPAPDRPVGESQAGDSPPRAVKATDRASGVFAVLLLVAPAIWLAATAGTTVNDASAPVAAALVAIFAVMAFSGSASRPSDAELEQAIAAEAPDARRVALAEALWLLPALAGGVVVLALLHVFPTLADAWSALVRLRLPGGFAPLGGVSFAVLGAIVGAGLGWLIRIAFTLVFGREAFGVGDIFILAAAGAAGGWDIALLGFLLAVLIALLGWILTLLLKRSVMIPFGPPLALGILAALWLNRAGARIGRAYADALVLSWRERPLTLLVLAGVLLVATAGAIGIAHLVRQLVEGGRPRDGSEHHGE
jgi:prepilin signal peptidase PulO-like enzyme (type II secretory pathway)